MPCETHVLGKFKILHGCEGYRLYSMFSCYPSHIQHINSKISKHVGILFKIRHFLPINTLKQIYYSLILPYLHYGIMSWGNTYPSRLTKVQTKQNKSVNAAYFFLAIIQKAVHLTSSYWTCIPNIDNIFRLKIFLLAHKISQNEANIPDVLQYQVCLKS